MRQWLVPFLIASVVMMFFHVRRMDRDDRAGFVLFMVMAYAVLFLCARGIWSLWSGR